MAAFKIGDTSIPDIDLPKTNSLGDNDTPGVSQGFPGAERFYPPFKQSVCDELRKEGAEEAKQSNISCPSDTEIRQQIGVMTQLDPKLDEEVLFQYLKCACGSVDEENSKGLWLGLGIVAAAVVGVWAVSKYSK